MRLQLDQRHGAGSTLRAREAHRLRRHVREGPGRQPRRDRHPGDADAAGDGDRLGRRLLGDRPRRAARPRGRRGVPARPRRPGRELPEHREDHRGRRRRPAPRPSTPATASWPRTPPSPSACEEAGLIFIGPPAEAIEAMGSKTEAREIMARRPGCRSSPARPSRPRTSTRRASRPRRSAIPIACKAAGGGGGKGFRVAQTRTSWRRPSRAPRARARSSSPTTRVYLERYLEDPRHVEVQVLADSQGQRDPPRRARLLDPAPPPEADRGGAGARTSTRRCASGSARSRPTRPRAVGYRSAGTVEGLQVGDDYFFLEMNTRVQVEHCVTEMVTGIDIVREQVRIAAGEPLSITQEEVELRGHAIECRINAEAAHKNFAPAPGRDHQLPRAGGSRRAGGLRRRGRLRGDADVRPDGRQADRLGRRPRDGDPRACCARSASTRSAG